MAPFQRKAKKQEKMEDTPVEIKDVRWKDAVLKGNIPGPTKTVASGDWAVPASDEFLEHLTKELNGRGRLSQFITFLNERISPKFRGGEQTYWSDWIMLSDGTRENKAKLLRLMIEKTRQRLNSNQISKNMQEHLINVAYLLDDDMGESLYLFGKKEIEDPEFNRILAKTSPLAKHPDGSLCEGERESLELDVLPDDLSHGIRSIFHFEELDMFERNLVDQLHENLELDGLPPAKVNRVKITDDEKQYLEAMSLTDNLEEFNILCDEMELPRSKVKFLPGKSAKQNENMEIVVKRSIAIDAINLFQNKLKREGIKRRMIPYILSFLARPNMFQGQFLSNRKKMKNLENLMRANFIRKTREPKETNPSSEPHPPPPAKIFHLKNELKNTKGWCGDCRKPHKPRATVREAEKRRSSRKEALFLIPTKELKKEPPEMPWEEPRSRAQKFFRSEEEAEFRKAYYTKQLFYRLFDEDEEEMKRARDEVVDEMIQEVIERAVDNDVVMRPAESSNWIVERRDPASHLDWITVEEPDTWKNREMLEWTDFYHVNHLQAPHPEKKRTGKKSR